MKIIQFSIFALAILLSCNAPRSTKSSVPKDRIETTGYKKFKNERVADAGGIAIIRKSFRDHKLMRVKFFHIHEVFTYEDGKLVKEET